MPLLIAIAIGMVRQQQSAVVALRIGDRRPVVSLLVQHLIAAAWLLLMATAFCVADDGGREARQGVLDLRGWNPVEDAPVRLNGEWRVAWRRLAGGKTSDGD